MVWICMVGLIATGVICMSMRYSMPNIVSRLNSGVRGYRARYQRQPNDQQMTNQFFHSRDSTSGNTASRPITLKITGI